MRSPYLVPRNLVTGKITMESFPVIMTKAESQGSWIQIPIGLNLLIGRLMNIRILKKNREFAFSILWGVFRVLKQGCRKIKGIHSKIKVPDITLMPKSWEKTNLKNSFRTFVLVRITLFWKKKPQVTSIRENWFRPRSG